MNNPYSPVNPTDPTPGSQLDAPAISLIIVSLIAITFGVIGLGINVFLVVSGGLERLEAMNEGPVSEATQMMIRVCWGIVLLIAASFVLYGSIQMKKRGNFQMARAASIVAMVPLVGPCCILGIPFGIWAFIMLSKPGVQESFRQ